MATFNIPNEHYSDFSDFLSLPRNIKEEINKSLRNTTFGNTPKDLVEKLYQDLGEKVEKDTISNIVSVYLNLVNLKNSIDNDDEIDEDFFEILKNSLSKTDLKELEPTQETLDDFINLVSSSDSIPLERRLWNLQSEHQKIFMDFEVFQDIRPLLVEEKIQGATIVSNVKISFRENGEIKSFFVALDSDDLNKMSKSVKSAQDNIKHIQSRFSDIPFIDKEDI